MNSVLQKSADSYFDAGSAVFDTGSTAPFCSAIMTVNYVFTWKQIPLSSVEQTSKSVWITS